MSYLKAFAPLADEIWANFPGDSDLDSQHIVDRLETLDDKLHAMTVPGAAEQMHLAFGLVSINVLQWHNYRAGARLLPDQFAEYMAAADIAGNDALAWYYQEYLPARDTLLARLGLTAESAGFKERDDGANLVTPSAATPAKPRTTPKPTKAPTSAPAMQLLADSQTDFSGGQGQNSWEYLFSDGRDTFNWKQMSFDGSCYRAPFDEPEVRICGDHGAAGVGGDIAWLYKAEMSGKLVFKITARKLEPQGDDVEIGIYRHTNPLETLYLDAGDTTGVAKQFELDVNGGEMFFFTMQTSSIWREFKYDPNAFRVQVYVKE